MPVASIKPAAAAILRLCLLLVVGPMLWHGPAFAVAPALSNTIDMNIYGPYFWASDAAIDVTPESVQQSIDKGDLYQVFMKLHRALLANRASKSALQPFLHQLDYMLESYQPADRIAGGVKWRYKYAYGTIPAKWWSGMEGLNAPLTMYLAYQLTGDDRYKAAALSTAKLYLRPVADGGIIWREGNSCWLSEYSWDGMIPSQEYHVLNGHLYALLSLYLLAHASKDAELMADYACSRAGTQEYAAKYYRSNDDWTFYQITPPVINQAHYLIFEVTLFDALFTATGDKFYKEQADHRRTIFASLFPVELERVGSGFQALVSSIGAPSPYDPDNYGFRLTCTVAGKQVVGVHSAFDMNEPLYKRLVFALPLDGIPSECDYEYTRADVARLLFRQTSFEQVDANYKSLSGTPEISLDAVKRVGAEVTIDPSFKTVKNQNSYLNEEARLTFALGTKLGKRDMIALSIASSADLSTGAILTDDNGKTAGRYLTPLKANCDNLVFINRVGFSNEEKLDSTIASVALRLYTTKLKQTAYVSPLRMALITNNAQLRQFLQQEADGCYPN